MVMLGFNTYDARADQLVKFTPPDSWVTIDWRKENGTSYSTVSIHFPDSGFDVSSWGNLTIAGNGISVDAEIWMWTGVSFPLDFTASNEYCLGKLAADKYVFTFKVWTDPVKSIEFTISFTVPDDYPTIQEAINNAHEGDTIFVRNGTYQENVVVNKTISLIGENEETTIVDGNYAGNVMNVTADNIEIAGFTVKNSHYSHPFSGIYIFSNCSKVNHIILINNFYGIHFNESSNDNRAYLNSIKYNSIGLQFDGSLNNSISGNVLKNNMVGIFLVGSNNSIFGNIIAENEWNGIVFYYTSSNNNVFNNNLTNNHLAIEVYEELTYNNVFYHNNFIGNQNDVYPTSTGTWDDGYPSGGNYWSDYNGPDLCKGPYQNETGSDGLGDIPVIINAESRDNYPLMKPYSGPNDVGIASLDFSRTVVGQGYCMNMSLKIFNYGLEAEYFNTTVNANTTIIYAGAIALEDRDSVALVFSWNTTGFAFGNYTISANVDLLSGETDTSDNNYTCSIPVHVGVPGDISGVIFGEPNGMCDMRDINYLIGKFNSRLGSLNWYPNCDINNDGVVNMRDINIAIRNFHIHE